MSVLLWRIQITNWSQQNSTINWLIVGCIVSYTTQFELKLFIKNTTTTIEVVSMEAVVVTWTQKPNFIDVHY